MSISLILTQFARIFVGVLFIFSGLIKLNDPLGFSYKLQEYADPQILNLEFIIPYALLLAIILVIVEVVLGVALLLGYQTKAVLWSLLAMIVLFTFLTFYSAYFNKVTDCGCFGDAIPLTPWESFTKDIILLLLIVFLIQNKHWVRPVFSSKPLMAILSIVLLGSVYFGIHVLNHLPAWDFRAYKVGTNIPEAMSYPEDAPQPVVEYQWLFDQNGKEVTVTTMGKYPDVAGSLLSVATKTISQGYEPPIHDFSLEQNGQDFTQELLSEEKLLLIVAYNLSNFEFDSLESLKNLIEKARSYGYLVAGATASGPEEAMDWESALDFPFYFCDETALKTIIRSNPGIVVIERGVIQQKLHWNDMNIFKE
ncbi:MAG: DoxX family protein [Flavobacteriaceae bacterium]|nr:DoxX family protein [Flavobacteriaceae bacterium]